ncbi:type II secretion system minor pseudopilin GspI [Pantoea endophytica]|uniref:Type II secretion system protein I n=1 Tax=Pantoea sp. BJ2 TaxID=3141322 RepID=A0AAU7U3R6_9GAMM
MTLIEVMVAMALLAIAGLALLNTTSEQVRNVHYLEKKQFAAWVAENQMILMTLTTSEPPASTQLAGEHWVWQVAQRPSTESGVQMREIAVWHEKAEGAPLIRLHSWIAQ